MPRKTTSHSIWRDRFIPPRSNLPKNIENNKENISDEENYCISNDTRFLNLAKIHFNKIKYQNALRSVMQLSNEQKPSIFFSSKTSKGKYSVPCDCQNWPVKPRKSPVIGPPLYILDMPQLGNSKAFSDWSSHGWLATVFDSEAYMWCSTKNCFNIVTDTEKRVENCLKWNKDGSKLALGLKYSKVGIWDFHRQKLTYENLCCIHTEDYHFGVECFEWADDCIIIICKSGFLSIKTSKLETISSTFLGKYEHEEICMALSCFQQYIAVGICTQSDVMVKILEFKGLNIFRQMQIIKNVGISFAWHPWKESLLAIGTKKLYIWNIQKPEVSSAKLEGSFGPITYLAFHPQSAELVVSYFNKKQKNNLIAVLTNFKTKIEDLFFHQGPIKQLLWGPNFEELASTSCDENIAVWNFFGSNNKRFMKNETKSPNQNISLNSLRF